MSRYPTYVFPVDAAELRVVKGKVQYRECEQKRWGSRSHAEMVRSFSVDHVIWPWLREHGYERSRSGPTQPESARKRGQLLLRLTPHVADILRDQAAELGIAVSGLVSDLVTRTWGGVETKGRRSCPICMHVVNRGLVRPRTSMGIRKLQWVAPSVAPVEKGG